MAAERTPTPSKKLRITWVRSAIGHSRDQKATIRALGLHRLHESVVHDDTPTIRGMVFKVQHLVRVEEVEE
jgi:large subunit ribosomal protein L30